MREGVLQAQHNYYEYTRTWWTTKDGQGCHHLPTTTTVPWGATHFLASTKPDTTSALDVRNSLEAFQRKTPSFQRRLTTLIEVRKPARYKPDRAKPNSILKLKEIKV